MMERKYIEETLSAMKKRMEHLQDGIKDFQKEIQKKEKAGEFTYGMGLIQGRVRAMELEVEYLQGTIAFLQKALN